MATPRDAFHVWIPIDVRWGDMDAFGHVNNAKYFTYCESARIRYFEEVGIRGDGPRGGLGPAVVQASCNFRRQVHYPAALEVGVRTSKIGRSSFTLDYAIYRRDDGELVADGSSVVVWVDYGAGVSRPLPDDLTARIRALDPLPA
ncbi:MAG: acyl-CoA thioesterase [Acidobacteria bacterium]|nr:MAG: acyl-CoA thioesterase [Acidobacteriota bacterium]